ncbi:hypothetical protein CDAR_489911 [Caerostris darwini]|uniref:Chitin-binding type-2 domain-containing protein n=1 Tax=Caerostris darwini TaxID=1538125 RepID=A0AAV4VLY4_9ARAC|nr:hypothetical protein CDAR_489911 [Caerostris darwini]
MASPATLMRTSATTLLCPLVVWYSNDYSIYFETEFFHLICPYGLTFDEKIAKCTDSSEFQCQGLGGGQGHGCRILLLLQDLCPPSHDPQHQRRPHVALLEAAACSEEYSGDTDHQLNREQNLVAFFTNTHSSSSSAMSYTNAASMKKDLELVLLKISIYSLSNSPNSWLNLHFRQTSGLYNFLTFHNVIL